MMLINILRKDLMLMFWEHSQLIQMYYLAPNNYLEIREIIEHDKVSCIFSEPQFNPDIINAVAKDMDIKYWSIRSVRSHS